MQDIAELERRITAALERIGRGIEGLSAVPAAYATSDTPSALLPESDFAALNEALDEERMLNAQLSERLRAVHQNEAAGKSALTEQVQELTNALAAKTDELAALRQALEQANTELATLRHARLDEADELAAIVAALNPLIEEASHA